MTQTANKFRIAYPLNDDDIRELEELETKLKGFAEDAANKKRVALHGIYNTILKNSTTTISRAKTRAGREANAERTRTHKKLKLDVQQNAQTGNSNGAGGNATGATGANTAP